jgi:transposase-like protein
MSYKRYTREFKQKVLRDADQEQNVSVVARRYAVSRQLIYEWQQHQRDGTLHDTELQRQAQLQRQVEELQLKVGKLTMENDFLKKVLESLETRFPQPAATLKGPSSSTSPKVSKKGSSR